MANEKRLIDAYALWAEFMELADTGIEFDGEGVANAIANAPTVDAEPVVRGHWINHNKGQNNWCECSQCNTVGSPFWKRCPVCEAKMDGDGNA